MKRVFLAVLSLAFILNARPPVPAPDASLVHKTQAIKKCRVPIEVAILPPAIDKDYKLCVNEYYKPLVKEAQKTLQDNNFIAKNDTVLEVNIAPGFTRGYEVIYAKSSEAKLKKALLCNETLANCYRFNESLSLDKKIERIKND